MIVLLIIALCIWWFVLQFQGTKRAIKWDRRKQALIFIGRYVRKDLAALWHWKYNKEPGFYED